MPESPTSTPPTVLPPTEPKIATEFPASRRMERRALAIFALAGSIAIFWMAANLGIGILLGALTAFTLQPVYRRIAKRWPKHPNLAALACDAIASLVVLGTITILGYLLVVRGIALAQRGIQLLEHIGAEHRGPPGLTRFLARFGVTVPMITSRIGTLVAGGVTKLTTFATSLATAMFHLLIVLFFMLISMHFTLRHWHDVVRHVQALLPLDPEHSRALLDEFRRVGKGVLLGTVTTGLAQGLLAYVGYLIVGVRDAAFFGAATAVASLVPAIGTLIVWTPIAVFMIVTGHAAHGVVLLLWGALVVVGVSDYVIRPRLAGGQNGSPTLVTFIAIFGGLEVFGLSGLILGPVIMALAMSLLRLYEHERPGSVALVTKA